jgi:hypothetical protein
MNNRIENLGNDLKKLDEKINELSNSLDVRIEKLSDEMKKSSDTNNRIENRLDEIKNLLTN